MAVSDNKKLLSVLKATWQAEMEGFYTYAALSEGEDMAVTERYQLDEPLQLPSSPQQHKRPQFGTFFGNYGRHVLVDFDFFF